MRCEIQSPGAIRCEATDFLLCCLHAYKRKGGKHMEGPLNIKPCTLLFPRMSLQALQKTHQGLHLRN